MAAIYRVTQPEDGFDDYSLEELTTANADDAELCAAIRGLGEGESLEIGGGAAVEYTVKRLRDYSAELPTTSGRLVL